MMKDEAKVPHADYSNPFMFDKCYPGYDIGDYNSDEAYEMGVSAGLISAKEKEKHPPMSEDEQMDMRVDQELGK